MKEYFLSIAMFNDTKFKSLLKKCVSFQRVVPYSGYFGTDQGKTYAEDAQAP